MSPHAASCGVVGPASAEYALHADVAFVTGVFLQQVIGPSKGKGNRPRPGVHLRIVDLNFVLEHVRAGACETLDKCQAVTGAAVRVEDRPRLKRAHPMIEIRGLHNERIAFPVTSGSAIPLADARCDRRAVVGGLLVAMGWENLRTLLVLGLVAGLVAFMVLAVMLDW